jgi:hypothetical protein
MHYLKYAIFLSILLVLAACGQVMQPKAGRDEALTILDAGQVAAADGTYPTITSIDFGNICQNTPASRTIRLYALTHGRTGKTPYTGADVWQNDQPLSVSSSVNAAGTNNGFAAPVPSNGQNSTVALPANWQLLPNNQRSADKANLEVHFNPGTTTGSRTGTITYALTGTNTANKPSQMTQNTVISVSANVIVCNQAPSNNPPVINIQQPLSFEGGTSGGWEFSMFSLIGTATDAEDGTPSVICSPAVGAVLPVGANSVSCTATDHGGLTTTASGTITVTDTTPPVISGVPTDITVPATSVNGASVSWTVPTAVDVVDGSIVVSCIPPSGSTFGVTTTAVTCEATDKAGNIASTSFTVTVEKVNQTIDFEKLGNKTYGDATFTVSATATSGLPVSFAASGECSVASGTVTITGAGSCTITASQAGDGQYNAAANVEQSFSIARAQSTTEVTVPSGAVYDGTKKTASAVTTGVGGEIIANPSVNYTPGDSDAPVNAGYYTANASFAGNTNYEPSSDSKNFNIAKANATIDVEGKTVTYDGNAHGASGTAKGVNDETLDGLDLGDSFTNAGTHTATWTFTDTTGNYNDATGTVEIVINKADQVISWNTPAAITYGAALGDAQLNATTSGDGVLTYSHTEGDVLDAGTHTLKVNADATNNYNAASKEVSLTVNKASTTTVVRCEAGPFTHNGSAHTPCTATVTGAGGLNEPVTVRYEDNTDAGTAKASASYTESANYLGSGHSETFVIDKATATISLSGLTHIFNGTPKSATATTNPTGLEGVTITYDGSTTAPTAAGSYAVVASLDNSNYEAQDATGTLVIVNRCATFQAPIKDRTRNVAKLGSVVPVKVILTDCNGQVITNESLFITLGSGTNGEELEGDSVLVESVSSADSGSQMRVSDGMYIYNFSTKNLSSGRDYTLRIRLGSTSGVVLVDTVLQPRK